MLVVVLDLVLLKAGAFRHLLFNRGSSPRYIGSGDKGKSSAEADALTDSRMDVDDLRRWKKTAELAVPLIAVDSYVRWAQLGLAAVNTEANSSRTRSWTAEDAASLARVVAGCIIETVAFQVGVTLACAGALALAEQFNQYRKKAGKSPTQTSGVRREFRLSHVPLTLLYSSTTKLFLLAMLSIWRSSPVHGATPAQTPPVGDGSWATTFWTALDDGTLDREWLVRNVLGGMAAGFGLRIALDTHPALTMLVILAGWTIKTATGALVGAWVADGLGAGSGRAEMWLAYSIP